MNHGNGYNAITGAFTAPLGGVYVFNLYFSLSGGNNIDMGIEVNGKGVCDAFAAGTNYDTGVCSAMAQLKPGDVVNVKKLFNGGLHNPAHGSGFSGFLYSAV